MAKKRSFHFSCGDSTQGSVGFCACVKATSKRKALEILRESIPETISVDRGLSFAGGAGAGAGAVEYFNVYLNLQAVTVNDVDEWDQ